MWNIFHAKDCLFSLFDTCIFNYAHFHFIYRSFTTVIFPFRSLLLAFIPHILFLSRFKNQVAQLSPEDLPDIIISNVEKVTDIYFRFSYEKPIARTAFCNPYRAKRFDMNSHSPVIL